MAAVDAEVIRRAAAPLDEGLYQPNDVEAAFLAQQTGIQDPEELKKHVVSVQAEAYAVFPYPCIRSFQFARLKAYNFPTYQDFLKLGRERKGALFLDVGCCCGSDVRKAIMDGYPADQIIASDLNAEFWSIGHKLFKSAPQTFPVKFIAGDIFDEAFLTTAPVTTSVPSSPPPALPSLNALTPLHGRLSAIHASAFFHLFSEEQQTILARRLASLLSPEPGSLIFGMHGALPERTEFVQTVSPDIPPITMFCHGPASWVALWEGVFGPGKVDVRVHLEEQMRKDFKTQDGPEKWYWLYWSVTRL